MPVLLFLSRELLEACVCLSGMVKLEEKEMTPQVPTCRQTFNVLFLSLFFYFQIVYTFFFRHVVSKMPCIHTTRTKKNEQDNPVFVCS